MLNGEPFMPFHAELLAEREENRKAVFRLNNTANEKVQIQADERFRQMQAIVQARWYPFFYRGPEPPQCGYMGNEVFVDTPFHCDYGYNLHISELVTIGPGCKFLDSGKIFIGRNSKIGAGVTIDTQRIPTDSKSVKGCKGLVVAAEVHIGENVYVGANATILAGVKIGTGAIIYPGSVVLKVCFDMHLLD
jgi:acetyltransferase-like isoleucine patch superfamily enzyme